MPNTIKILVPLNEHGITHGDNFFIIYPDSRHNMPRIYEGFKDETDAQYICDKMNSGRTKEPCYSVISSVNIEIVNN